MRHPGIAFATDLFPEPAGIPCSFCNLTISQLLSYLVSPPQPWTVCSTHLGQPTKEKLLKGSLLIHSSYMPQPFQSMLQYDPPQRANFLLTCTVVKRSWICCSLVMPRMHRMHLLWEATRFCMVLLLMAHFSDPYRSTPNTTDT